ncbi:unnamed protein product, partial [Ilex paraguariensis]
MRRKRMNDGEYVYIWTVKFSNWPNYGLSPDREAAHSKTFIGINAINRRFWVCAMMEDVSKNGVLAVQTLRNNIMASTVLASMAITLCSVIALLMGSAGGSRSTGLIYAVRSTELGFSIKLFSIL